MYSIVGTVGWRAFQKKEGARKTFLVGQDLTDFGGKTAFMTYVLKNCTQRVGLRGGAKQVNGFH